MCCGRRGIEPHLPFFQGMIFRWSMRPCRSSPAASIKKQIIACLPPGGNILNLILPCSCLPDHCKRQGLPLSRVCGCRSEARVTPWMIYALIFYLFVILNLLYSTLAALFTAVVRTVSIIGLDRMHPMIDDIKFPVFPIKTAPTAWSVFSSPSSVTEVTANTSISC